MRSLLPDSRRAATSTLEVIVACTLMSSVLAVFTPLVVKHRRLLSAQRDYRLALDEVSNQLERLTALSEDEVSIAVQQLKPSEFAAARLPGAELRGELESIDLGRRLKLELIWDEPQRRGVPVALAAWLLPAGEMRGNVAARSQSP
jgi:hypothetical protein